ncbi:MAG: molybdopterin-dependent oxidoreductase [Bacteroidia bacterium]
MLELIAAANIYTIKKYGPGNRIIGFLIPAMSMLSYASGAPLFAIDRWRNLSSTTGIAICLAHF